MDFYFTNQPRCDYCGKLDPYVPLGFDKELGYVCPTCAFSDNRITMEDVCELEARVRGMRNMYLFYQTLKSKQYKRVPDPTY